MMQLYYLIKKKWLTEKSRLMFSFLKNPLDMLEVENPHRPDIFQSLTEMGDMYYASNK